MTESRNGSMSKTVLVTGGAGFIGGNFVRLLLNETDYAVVNVDALTYAGNLISLQDIEDHPRYTFVHGNICDEAVIQNVLNEYAPSSIVNFAAETHVDRSIQGADEFLQTNVLGVQALLKPVIAGNIERFVQVSTDEVYGSLGPEGRFTETTPLDPGNPYSASKAAADFLVRAAVNTYGIDACITRCSNNYGPFQFPEKLIPLMIHRASHGKTLPVYGDGQQVRDWIHVEDHCRAVLAVLERGKKGEVYNIGAENEIQNIEVVRTILTALDKPDSLIEFVKDRPGHDRRYAMDNTKISRELGWHPTVSFAQGMQATIDWYSNNAEWIQSIISKEYIRYFERQYGTASGT